MFRRRDEASAHLGWHHAEPRDVSTRAPAGVAGHRRPFDGRRICHDLDSADYEDAPCVPVVRLETVNLETDPRPFQGGVELRSVVGGEHNRVRFAIVDVAHRKDLGASLDYDTKAPERGLLQPGGAFL